MQLEALKGDFYHDSRDQRSGYKGYNYQRRQIISSPNNNFDHYKSPFYTPQRDIVGPVDLSTYSIPHSIKTGSDFVPKNPIFLNHSPGKIYVKMPNDEYEIDNISVSTRSSRSKASRRSRRSKNFESDSEFSSCSESDSKYSRRRREKQEREEDRRMMRAMMERLIKIEEQNAKLKEEQERKEKNCKNTSQKQSSHGYTIPKSEPIEIKSKIPNYEEMDESEKDAFREKFRNNYNLLKIRYPKWTIQTPDFNVLPLRTIHERYEEVVRMICIYQTAMKWKVYIIVIIAGIEYYVGYKKNQAFIRGLLESQIKTIHKYETYLIELATMFYSDEVGEEYPLWVRFLGTFASSLATFSSINGAAKSFGVDAPSLILEEADKFVSPPEGTAKLRSDGISDVPEPPENGTLQDPNAAIGGINFLFNMAKGFIPGANSSSQPAQQAQPIPEADVKPKKVDDWDNADI